ncbi:MAG: hypothetical protein NC123_15395 [Butyrivibrio sp.]|nr:hypothetical protein [Acetatifactor muris]MCM1560905.1 hypothetical protein [Butyrivibrio sp.]
MARNFFMTLRQLEKDREDGRLPAGAGAVLKQLITFVESGFCTTSQAERFVLANFRLGGSEMACRWNRMYPESRKKPETFRGQISLVSRYLCSLFGVSPDGLETAFNGNDSQTLGYIADILEMYPKGGENLAEGCQLLIRGGFLDAGAVTSSVYGADECTEEVRLLKSLDHDTVQAMLDKVDRDKLIYVLQSLREPLVSDMYVKQQDKKRKVKTPSVNKAKLEFSKALASVGLKEPKAVSGAAKREPADLRLPGMPQSFREILAAGLGIYEEQPEAYKQRQRDKSTEGSRQECRRVLELFTEEGFRACLRKLNKADLAEEAGYYRQG